MELMKWVRKHWLILAVLIVLLILFFPKYCGYSYGGFVTTGMTLHREECTCLGIKYETWGDPFNLGWMCMDCGKTHYCAGIPAGRSCFEWVAATDKSTEKQVECG